MFTHHTKLSIRAGAAALAVSLSLLTSPAPAQSSSSVTFGGRTFTNQGLVGVGRIPSSFRDSFGETFGSFSAMTFDPRSWKSTAAGFTGTLYTQPDRGYNAVGTTAYVPRFNVINVTFAPTPAGASTQTQVGLTVAQTIQYKEADGTLFTSLDPAGGPLSRPGFPALPGANGRISLDGEGIVRLADGSFFTSDEYGPYIYHFSSSGTLLSAIRPPSALIPIRNGTDNFASNNPGPGQSTPVPADPVTGRQNNQGLEGLTLTPDGRYLAALLQSATRQDGGTGGTGPRSNTRLLLYDLSAGPDAPKLVAEHVVQLPTYVQGSTRVAAQSEMLALNNSQFLVLARDSGNGRGFATPTSLYRQILIYDISAATNIAGTAFDTAGTPIAPGGTLAAGITPATRVELVNLNDAAQLAKFGLTNGPTDSANNLSEKWEGLSLVPALDAAAPNDAYLFVGNDNDFLTTDGFQVGAAYNAGVDNDSMILVYRLTLPTWVDPLAYSSMADTGAPLFQSLRLSLNQSTRNRFRDTGGQLTRLRLGQPAKDGWSVFTNGGGQSAERDAVTGVAADETNGWDAGGGLRFDAGPLGFGVTAGRSDTRTDVLGGIGRHEVEGGNFGGFVSYRHGPFYFLGDAYQEELDVETSRNTGVYGLTARGEGHARGQMLRGLAGVRGSLGGLSWAAEAGRDVVRHKIDAMTETGAIQAGIELPAQTTTSDRWQASVQVSRDLQLGAFTVSPYFRGTYEQEMEERTAPLTLALAGRSTVAGGTYTVPAVKQDSSTTRGTLGAAALLRNGLWLNLSVDTSLSGKKVDDTVFRAAVQWSF